MKKVIIASLMMLSTIALAKTEEPKAKIDFPKKEEKVLIANKKLAKETNKKTVLKQVQSPLSQCVLDNAISLQVGYILMGIPMDGDTAVGLATVMCATGFGVL